MERNHPELGRWYLHEKTVQKINEIDKNRVESQLDFMPDLQTYREVPIEDWGVSNDFLSKESFIHFAEEDAEGSDSDSVIMEEEVKDIPTLVNNIIDCIEEKTCNIPVIISTLSKINESILSEVIITAWSKLLVDNRPDRKRSFIIALSSTHSSRITLCRELIAPWLKTTKQFDNTMEILEPVIHWLDVDVTDNLIIPFINDRNNLFITENDTFTHFFKCLSQAQRYHALSAFLDFEKIDSWQFEVFEIMVESTHLDESLMLSLIQVLNRLLSYYSSDRTIGKIVLHLTEELVSRDAKKAVPGVLELSDKFKGILKFKIKKVLKRIS